MGFSRQEPVEVDEVVQAALLQHLDDPGADAFAAHGDQTQGNAFTVVQFRQILAAFNAVADGMSEVQDLTQASFLLFLAC